MPTNLNCRNCDASIYMDSKFCSHCGQKNTDGKIKILDFFSEFFSSIFNLDTPLFRSLAAIIVPGKLTIHYFQGKHKQYLHPLRFFLVSAIFLLAAIFYQIKDENLVMFSNTFSSQKIIAKIQQNKFRHDYDSLHQNIKITYPNTMVQEALDSLERSVNNTFKMTSDTIDLGVIHIFGDKIDNRISNEDFITLTPKEIIEKYSIKGFWNQIGLTQKIKILKNNDDFARFCIGGLTWIVLLMMPFLAFLLKLIYIRKKMYYVEHLVFSFHVHTFTFLFFIAPLLIWQLIPSTHLITVTFLGIFLYLIVAIKRVYQQSWRATLFWILVINFCYLFIFSFSLIFGLMVSTFLF